MERKRESRRDITTPRCFSAKRRERDVPGSVSFLACDIFGLGGGETSRDPAKFQHVHDVFPPLSSYGVFIQLHLAPHPSHITMCIWLRGITSRGFSCVLAGVSDKVASTPLCLLPVYHTHPGAVVVLSCKPPRMCLSSLHIPGVLSTTHPGQLLSWWADVTHLMLSLLRHSVLDVTITSQVICMCRERPLSLHDLIYWQHRGWEECKKTPLGLCWRKMSEVWKYKSVLVDNNKRTQGSSLYRKKQIRNLLIHSVPFLELNSVLQNPIFVEDL